MRFVFGVCLSLLFSSSVLAQPGKKGDAVIAYSPELISDELELSVYMWKAVRADSAFDRNDANYLFIRKLAQTLRQENAYHYPFDSLKAISILEAPDKSFKIYSWQVKQEGASYRHFGCILKNDAGHTLIPLIDQSDELAPGTDTVVGSKNWFGAAYYQLLPDVRKVKKVKYYTLIGYDGFEPFSQRKIIDVLWFNEAGEPQFGAPIFKLPGGVFTRVIFEYAKDANMQLRWDADNKMIIGDHLVPRNEANRGLYFDYATDGSFDGFSFKKGQWLYKDNVDLRMKTSARPTSPKKP